MAYIKSLPINDTPEIFGLHDNANITFAQNETYTMLATLLLLQPKTSSASGRSREEVTGDTSVPCFAPNDFLFIAGLVAYWPARIHDVALLDLYCPHVTSGRLAVCYS